MEPSHSEFVDTTHLEDSARISPKGDHESGPPNRINDLNYSDWMKFQKSFYRYPGDQTAVSEYIYFFTKEQYDDQISETLLLGFDSVDTGAIETARKIHHRSVSSITDVISFLTEVPPDSYDFILVDFRKLITDASDLETFFEHNVDDFWSSLRDTVNPGQFAGIFVGLPDDDGSGFPLPWAIAGSCREEMRLKDEKIGLFDESNEVLYSLFVQAKDDHRKPTRLDPTTLSVSSPENSIDIPSWCIPKPPARDENEILHPAKYPETLVEKFISIFTNEGDTVFDPMVGTGSTVLAAIRNERDGYGVDLKKEYVEIARDRIDDEYHMTLSGNVEPQAENRIKQGDSTERSTVAFKDVTFDYVVTSPPYWSMLNNSGSENQKTRREKGLPLKYSDQEDDLGNIEAYSDFLDTLVAVYDNVSHELKTGGYLTVVVKNVKRDHIIYPLAWDIVERLCSQSGSYDYVGTTLWCQDDIGLKPFAVGTHWVSNTLHNYCLHFKNKSN